MSVSLSVCASVSVYHETNSPVSIFITASLLSAEQEASKFLRPEGREEREREEQEEGESEGRSGGE